ncbi:MAG: ADP-ribosylglycohydrolase family protein [Bacteroidales bacterium]|nr:ADP-ribosylglycohydrolase family protein [Bacteroidales bacterium]
MPENNKQLKCVGGIIGDIIGQRFEFRQIRMKSKDFQLYTVDSRFTDDTVMTCAIMDWLTNGGDLPKTLRKWGDLFPRAGYGGMFRKWLSDESMGAYGSYGNGSGMRVSPVGWAAQSIDECLEMAKDSAMPTHNHEEGIKGAQAIASSIFMARTGKTKDEIKEFITSKFGYDLERTVYEIRPKYRFEVSCQKSVPESIICFLEGTSYEDCVRNAVSLGGDTDTQADMTGAIAEAFGYPIDSQLYDTIVASYLPDVIFHTIYNFNRKFIKE